jgi:hypothetical protein
VQDSNLRRHTPTDLQAVQARLVTSDVRILVLTSAIIPPGGVDERCATVCTTTGTMERC